MGGNVPDHQAGVALCGSDTNCACPRGVGVRAASVLLHDHGPNAPRALAAMATFPCHVIPSNDTILYCARLGRDGDVKRCRKRAGTAPLLVFVFSAIFLPHERLNWRKATGVMIGFAGVVLVANPSGSAVSQTSVTGLLFLLLGAISLSLSFIYARKFLAQHDIPAGALVTYQLESRVCFCWF